MRKIHGIPCELVTPAGRRAVREVLNRIKTKCPADYERLKTLVLAVRPLTQDEGGGTLGEWVPAFHGPVEGEPSSFGYGYDATPGHAYLLEDGSEGMVAVLAHEFGHACSSREDCDGRGSPFQEWNSEAAADWHADTWGFGEEIERTRADRNWLHHGPTPGSYLEVEEAGGRVRYHLSRDFVFRAERISLSALTT